MNLDFGINGQRNFESPPDTKVVALIILNSKTNMNKIFFIEKTLVLKIHAKQVKHFGGIDGFSQQYSHIESALGTPIMVWNYTQDVYETAAQYYYSLVSRNCFLCANKSTAMAFMLLFLRKNGVRVLIKRKALYKAIGFVTESLVPRSRLSSMLRKNSIKMYEVTHEKIFSNEWLSWNSVGICSLTYQSLYYKTVAEIKIEDVVFKLQERANENHSSIFRFGRNIIYVDNYSSFPSNKPESKFSLIASFILGNISGTFEITELRVSWGNMRFTILKCLEDYIYSRYSNVKGFSIDNIEKSYQFHYETIDPLIQLDNNTYDLV